MSWTVVVCFWREKRHCPNCNKIRSEVIDFICETTPHVTEELAWWINRLTEITSVLAVGRLENIDKTTCYAVDKHILMRLLQAVYAILSGNWAFVVVTYSRSLMG